MFDKILKLLAAVWFGLTLSEPALSQNITGNVIPPGANTGTTVTPTYVNVTYYGAKCDGVTDDSTAFTNSLAANSTFIGPAPVYCLVKNLVVPDRITLDCRGSVLQAAPGAQWIVKKTGFASQVRNCIIYDPTYITEQTTTITSAVSPGTNVIPVASALNFQVNMIASVQLASGAYWTSKITAVNTVTNTITISDPIPWTVTGLTLVNGGSGWGNNREGIMLQGTGAPATATLTVSGGAVTALSLDAPGLYQSNPGTSVSFYDPGLPAAYNLAVNATYGGASAGGFVDAAFGAMIVDNANGGVTQNLVISVAPVGLEVLASTGQTTGELVDTVNINTSPIAGFARLNAVNNSEFRNIVAYGAAHHASAYGGAGVYLEATNRTYANGGNTFNVWALGFETGIVDINGQLDTFLHAKPDTNRNYGMLCIGCQQTNFPYLWAAFTGPNALSSLGSIASKGIGAYFGSSPAGNAAINNTITDFETSSNASDLHFGDPAGYVRIGNVWGPSKNMTAVAASSVSLISAGSVLTMNPSPIGGLSSPQYIGPNGILSSQNTVVGQAAGFKGVVTGMNVHAGIAPGSATYTTYLYTNPWNGTVFTGWLTVGSCTITGTATACSVNNSGFNVGPQDLIDFSVASTGGTFVANQNLSVQVLGQ